MKLYLDNSFLNRPFDDQSIPRNKIEAELLFEVMRRVSVDVARIVGSAVIEYENSKNSNVRRRAFVASLLQAATSFQPVTLAIRDRAQHIEQAFRIAPLDALHIASAEAADVDFFITCDQTLIKRYKDAKIVVVSPLTFFETYATDNKK